MLRFGISILLGGSSRITNIMHPFKETHGGVRNTSVHSDQLHLETNIACKDKFRSGHLRTNEEELNLSREVSEDSSFRLDLSQMVKYDMMCPLDHDLRRCGKILITDDQQWDDIPPLVRRSDLDDSDTECEDDGDVDATVGDNQGDSGSQEYCFIVETEGLTLLNEGKVDKEEKDDFYFM